MTRPSDTTLSVLVAVVFAAGWLGSWFVYRWLPLPSWLGKGAAVAGQSLWESRCRGARDSHSRPKEEGHSARLTRRPSATTTTEGYRE